MSDNIFSDEDFDDYDDMEDTAAKRAQKKSAERRSSGKKKKKSKNKPWIIALIAEILVIILGGVGFVISFFELVNVPSISSAIIFFILLSPRLSSICNDQVDNI
jgi:hypothetical protein